MDTKEALIHDRHIDESHENGIKTAPRTAHRNNNGVQKLVVIETVEPSELEPL